MNRHIEKSIGKWYNINAFQYIDERVARTVPQITRSRTSRKCSASSIADFHRQVVLCAERITTKQADAQFHSVSKEHPFF